MIIPANFMTLIIMIFCIDGSGLVCRHEPTDDPPNPPADWLSLPAIVSVYDPMLCAEPDGVINCDDDPTVFATMIPVGPEWYGRAVACDPRLLGSTVTFPNIGSFHCIDTGDAIGVRWSPLFGRWVVAFDIMVDLANGFPEWSYSLAYGWLVDWIGADV